MSVAENCAYSLAPLPPEVPPLPEHTCATSPNLPAAGQPVLQNYSITLEAGATFESLYRKALAEHGWSVSDIKVKKTAHGEMSHFEATHPNHLTLRIMIHGHGAHNDAHHSGITHATIAVQQTATAPKAPTAKIP